MVWSTGLCCFGCMDFPMIVPLWTPVVPIHNQSAFRSLWENNENQNNQRSLHQTMAKPLRKPINPQNRIYGHLWGEAQPAHGPHSYWDIKCLCVFLFSQCSSYRFINWSLVVLIQLVAKWLLHFGVQWCQSTTDQLSEASGKLQKKQSQILWSDHS